MKAIVVSAPGGPEVMRLEERTLVTPKRGEAVVQVAAAGVNFIDIYHRSGQYPQAEIRLGLEGAGTVLGVGPDTAGLEVGARVAWVNVAGSYATHVVAPLDRLVPIPDEISFETAAAVMLQGMTAHYLVSSTFALARDHTALLHAAAGGVGLLATQLGAARGARIIGTTSTAGKAARAKAAGCSEVILYGQQDFVAEARRLTDGLGVHVVYDSVGKDTFERSLRALRRRGTLVLFGQSSGAVAPFDPQLLARSGSLTLTRPVLGDYTSDRQELMWRASDLFAAIARAELDVHIDTRLPLGEASRAHELIASRRTTGKVLLIP